MGWRADGGLGLLVHGGGLYLNKGTGFGPHDVVVLKLNKDDAGLNALGQSMVYHLKDSSFTVTFDGIPEERLEKVANEEYGGGAFAVSGDNVVLSNYKDQRLYLQSISQGGITDPLPSPITPDYGGPTVCYAVGVLDSRIPRSITVMEGLFGA